jgi:hypothetical protein
MTFRKTSGVQIRGLNPVGSGLYWNELIHNEHKMHPYSPLALRKEQSETFVTKETTTYNNAFVSTARRTRDVARLASAGKSSFYAKYDTPRRETRRYEALAEVQKQAHRINMALFFFVLHS